MSKSVEIGRSSNSSAPDAPSLVSLTRTYELKFGPLFLLVFVINVAVAMLAWVLVSLLN
jgi:hypothetical protein